MIGPASRRAHLTEFGTTHSRAFPFMLSSATEQETPFLQRVRQAGKAAEQELAITDVQQGV